MGHDAYEFLGLTGSQWAFINTFAPWLSALGTLCAVTVSLWLARRASTPRARAAVGIVYIFNTPMGTQELLSFSLVNRGDRPITVSSIGWEYGFVNWGPKCIRKHRLVQMHGGNPYDSKMPITLAHGES